MHRVAVIPGDGTGPEVIYEALKILEAVAVIEKLNFEFDTYDIGGERYKRTGEILPESVLKELRSFDAILLGAIGHPDVKPGILERGILLAIRFKLNQYINLRPVKLYPGVFTPLKDTDPEDVDFVIVRENVEGLYVGEGEFINKGTDDEIATQISRNSRAGIDDCLRYAFELTRIRDKKKELLLCGKTNVLTYSFDLWERAFHEMGQKDYPDIVREYGHVDAVCMWMVKNPRMFDVIATDNMFGDIITDLGAIIQGGMGVAAGGNINPEGVSMFEPIGGSAPKYVGQNAINPIAAILAAKMMLDCLGETRSAERIEKSVMYVVAEKMRSMSAGRMGYTTQEVGDLVANHL